MKELNIFDFSWTCYSGLWLNLLYIDFLKEFKLFNKNMEININGSLFGFNISKDFISIGLFFKEYTFWLNPKNKVE